MPKKILIVVTLGLLVLLPLFGVLNTINAETLKMEFIDIQQSSVQSLSVLKNYANGNMETRSTENSLGYQGQLRVYVVEPVSRWNNYDGEPYHFGFLDYAINESLSIPVSETFQTSVTWDGEKAGYSDINEDNLMVIAAIFNPRGTKKYAHPPVGNPFDAHFVDATAAATPGNERNNEVSGDFTHTVFVEEATATWCPYCPAMADALYSVYDSGDYPFYFVAHVSDKNPIAAERLDEYNLYGYPTSFFDGGYKVLVGGYEDESYYANRIESSAERDVHDLNLSVAVKWEDNGRINIEIDITNNEEMPNNPPDKPNIDGTASGETGKTYNYSAVTSDPDGDKITYCFDWGDNSDVFCTDYFESGETATASHTWEEDGDYTITVTATDQFGGESEPTTLEVSMPFTKSSKKTGCSTSFLTAGKVLNSGFTHTVLVEEATGTFCSYCPTTAEALQTIYEEGELPFYYVAFVGDKNDEANTRLQEDYNIYGYPTCFFDGGNQVLMGAETNDEVYKNLIAESGGRPVPNLRMDLSTTWAQGCCSKELFAEIQVDNEENIQYNGQLKVYLVEINSRWNDYEGNPYHYAFLDFVANKNISINANSEYTDLFQWIPPEEGFPNVDPANLMVIAAIFNAEEHQGYANPPDGNPFTAHYVDAVTAEIVQEGNLPPAVGIVHPREGQLYVFDNPLRSTISGNTVLIGTTTIAAYAEDDTAVDKVEIYIDGDLKQSFTQAPYEYAWQQRTFGRHTIRVVATDNEGKIRSSSVEVIKIL